MNNLNFKLIIDKAAIEKIVSVLKTKESHYFFRIDISAGGCSGFSSTFRIDNEISEEDIIIEDSGAKVVINKQLAELIEDAELKYHTDILSSYFNLDVKTAKSKCSCGTSFSL